MPRPRKPTYLKLISGTDQPCRRNNHEPVPVGALDADAPPDWLTVAQKEIWRCAIKHAPPGLLKLLDRGIVSVWVVSADLHRQAAQAVGRYGAIVKGKAGHPIQSPFARVLAGQSQLMLRAAAQLGFTPATRARVKASVAGDRANPNRFQQLRDEVDEDS